MIKAEVQWLQRNELTRLDYDARYAAELSNLFGLKRSMLFHVITRLNCSSQLNFQIALTLNTTRHTRWSIVLIQWT